MLETIHSDIKICCLFVLKGIVFIGAGIYVFFSPLAGYIGLSVLFSMVIISFPASVNFTLQVSTPG